MIEALWTAFQHFISHTYWEVLASVEYYWPKTIGALLTLVIGVFIAIWVYKATMYIYRRFKIWLLIDKLEIDFWIEEVDSDEPITLAQKRKLNRKKLTERVQIDKLLAKSFSYYIFLVFFRLSIVVIGITDVEKFLGDLLTYLPSLFIWVVIGFFGMRFSDTVYDVIYHTMELTKQKASKVIAMGGKIVILFFTLMLVLNYIKIVDQFIINTFIIGFVTTITIGIGLAFGLGGKDIAKEILESFKK